MRVAVFSDIHANLEALEAVLEHVAVHDVDRYVCLGDVVGYGANPNECIDMLSALPGLQCLMGNHDAAVLGHHIDMNAEARKAMYWTRNVLTEAGLRFLQQMQDIIKWGDVLFCHANPYRPREWFYVDEKSNISSSFARSKAKIVFVGHTHVPVAITRRNFFCVYIRPSQHSMVVPAAELNRQIFNCGSIGQPRDGDPRASYLIYDDRKCNVEFYRVIYDVARAAGKILDAGLPEMLATRLASGL